MGALLLAALVHPTVAALTVEVGSLVRYKGQERLRKDSDGNGFKGKVVKVLQGGKKCFVDYTRGGYFSQRPSELCELTENLLVLQSPQPHKSPFGVEVGSLVRYKGQMADRIDGDGNGFIGKVVSICNGNSSCYVDYTAGGSFSDRQRRKYEVFTKLTVLQSPPKRSTPIRRPEKTKPKDDVPTRAKQPQVFRRGAKVITTGSSWNLAGWYSKEQKGEVTGGADSDGKLEVKWTKNGKTSRVSPENLEPDTAFQAPARKSRENIRPIRKLALAGEFGYTSEIPRLSPLQLSMYKSPHQKKQSGQRARQNSTVAAGKKQKFSSNQNALKRLNSTVAAGKNQNFSSRQNAVKRQNTLQQWWVWSNQDRRSSQSRNPKQERASPTPHKKIEDVGTAAEAIVF